MALAAISDMLCTRTHAVAFLTLQMVFVEQDPVSSTLLELALLT